MRILFLCIHNSARSQIAEAIFRHLGEGKIKVKSAGSQPTKVNPYVYRVLEEAGVNTEGLCSKDVKDFLGEKFDFIITLCGEMRETCPLFPGEHRDIHWPLSDPAGVKGGEEDILSAFRRVRDTLKALAIEFLGLPRGKARIRCPSCGFLESVDIPQDRCLAFWKCPQCGKIASAPRGSCCVICGYSDRVCEEFLQRVRAKFFST